MPVPQFLLDLLQLLFDLAVPAAFCTLAAAGVSLRYEGGTGALSCLGCKHSHIAVAVSAPTAAQEVRHGGA